MGSNVGVAGGSGVCVGCVISVGVAVAVEGIRVGVRVGRKVEGCGGVSMGGGERGDRGDVRRVKCPQLARHMDPHTNTRTIRIV